LRDPAELIAKRGDPLGAVALALALVGRRDFLSRRIDRNFSQLVVCFHIIKRRWVLF
jgi:hypothetical protein